MVRITAARAAQGNEMPVPAVIATAAENYRFNSDTLAKMISDLAPDEWFKHPDGNPNHTAWIVGHCIWARKSILARLGTVWSQPWLDLFKRGAPVAEDSSYPAPAAMIESWAESSKLLAAALESASEGVLSQPATQGPPSADGKISGLIGFLAIHETYHIGQASYLRGWLGHKGIMG
jgi:uncharacterized damage-inducible protein DinB